MSWNCAGSIYSGDLVWVRKALKEELHQPVSLGKDKENNGGTQEKIKWKRQRKPGRHGGSVIFSVPVSSEVGRKIKQDFEVVNEPFVCQLETIHPRDEWEASEKRITCRKDVFKFR